MIAERERDRLELLVHEVRSPVAAVVAISDALADGDYDASSVRELVRLALDACQAVERIVTDAAAGELQLDRVDIGALVRDAVAAASLEGGDVRVSVETGVLRIRADRVRVRQALDNLIRNALVHSGTREVLVEARTEPGSVLVSVRDAGRGIRAEDQTRIFEPGARLEEAASGSGLGLAVVRSIANAHGGSVRVESRPGAGATFTIVLPR
jgi:signal transduction histidine kinase